MRAFILIVVFGFIALNSVSAAKPRKYQQPYQSYQPYQPYQPYYQPHGKLETSEEEPQDLSKIPGEAGRDYPIYHIVPQTSFSCDAAPFVPGMYADVEAGCQAYHVCQDGHVGHQGASFLCSNGTLFNQKEFTCDWWYKVDCREAPDHYRLNGDIETNPFAPKTKSAEDKSAEQISPLPGLKYYKQRSRSGPSDYLYNQPYEQSYQQPYKPSYQQPYKSKKLLYKQPPSYQQYEQQEYQEQPYQPNQESYDESAEKYHPTRFH